MKRLRLLFIANGASVHTKRWLRFFAKHHDVFLISVPPLSPQSKYEEGITVLKNRASAVPGITLFLIWLDVRRAVRDIQPDLLHAHLLVPNAWLAAASGFQPFVTTAWGSDLLLSKGWHKLLNRWAVRKASLNTGDSVELLEKFKELGVQQENTALIQWGIDTDFFSSQGTSLRDELGLPSNAQVIFSPRILQPLYNAKTIALAFCFVAKEFPRAYLLLSTYQSNPEYEEEVRAILAQAGVEHHVRYVGPQPHENMPVLYRTADIVLSVPDSDSTPVTLLETMATGTIPIASNLPSVAEWIHEPQNGFLVPPRDTERLVQALRTALGLSPQQRAEMQQRNRESILERADHTINMMKMERLYFEHYKKHNGQYE